ncbi:recombinase family protein [Corynebacterium comes]|uniref:recombinase family protein n=1 Tax=Corynebacterium comes TaxID=2675218 RepID=UPI001E653408|nr:recombinase family protein [Corynebacterium comes]
MFTDTTSSSLESRPEPDKVLDQLRSGDTLIVWRLDSLGCSIRHLSDQLAELQEPRVEFRSLQENLDSADAARVRGRPEVGQHY